MLARMVTHALVGLDARRVEVEAHLQRGVPGFSIVGLADRACQEAKERVRSGIASAELEWPMRRITVNLAPAGLRKEGSGFDLPIALSILAASGTVRSRPSSILPTSGARNGRDVPWRSPQQAGTTCCSPARRVAETISALAAESGVGADHLAEALSYRSPTELGLT